MASNWKLVMRSSGLLRTLQCVALALEQLLPSKGKIKAEKLWSFFLDGALLERGDSRLSLLEYVILASQAKDHPSNKDKCNAYEDPFCRFTPEIVEYDSYIVIFDGRSETTHGLLPSAVQGDSIVSAEANKR
jgi:hypothetical protein